MNEAVLTQPITAGDLAALSGALSAPAVTQTQAQNTYIKMLVQMQNAPEGIAPTPNQIFTALAAGAQSKADQALYEALAFETMIGGSTFGLIVQAAGFIQIFTWIENAASWFKANANSIGTLLTDIGEGKFSDALAQAMSLLGISSSSKTPAKDSSGLARQGLLLLMSSEAPLLATATTFMGSKKTMASGAAGSGSGSGSGAGSGSNGSSNSNNGSGSTASDAAGPRSGRGTKRIRDQIGLSPRMRLVNRR